MMRFLTLISLLLISLQSLAIDIKMSLDRSWGLLIGDMITATVELPVAVSELDPSSLPQHEKRYGPWLYLHDSLQQGQTMTLHFQLINVPAENREVATPEFELRTRDGEFMTVPSVPMQIGSFMEQAQGENDPTLIPRGDMRLQPQAQPTLIAVLWTALVVFVLSSLIWLVWHFG